MLDLAQMTFAENIAVSIALSLILGLVSLLIAVLLTRGTDRSPFAILIVLTYLMPLLVAIGGGLWIAFIGLADAPPDRALLVMLKQAGMLLFYVAFAGIGTALFGGIYALVRKLRAK